jgi:hypothetical protein
VPVLLENLIELVGTLPADQTGKEEEWEGCTLSTFRWKGAGAKGPVISCSGYGYRDEFNRVAFFSLLFSSFKDILICDNLMPLHVSLINLVSTFSYSY